MDLWTGNSWPHTWTKDERRPLWTFDGKSEKEPVIGFFLLSIPFWIELLMCVVAEVCLCAVVARVFYTFLKHSASNPSYRLTIGYGVFVAGWVVLTKPCVDAMGITNKVFRFCLGVITPTTALFRTTAALHGFSPPQANQSWFHFCLYYASPLTLTYDAKTMQPIPISCRASLIHLARFTGLLYITGGFQSLFHIIQHFPSFGDKKDSIVGSELDNDWYDPAHILSPTRWRSTLLYALLFQLYLTTFGEGLLFLTQFVTGLKAQPIMDNPMLESTSPSDFWGRRWNHIIHTCLKNGVYKPVRSNSDNHALAVAAAFVASGLFHEWLLPVVFFDYPVPFGVTLLFFAWQGALVALEAMIGDWKIFWHLSQALPAPIRTLMVILLGVPLGHWFCDAYVRSDFFRQASIAFPCFLPVEMMKIRS